MYTAVTLVLTLGATALEAVICASMASASANLNAGAPPVSRAGPEALAGHDHQQVAAQAGDLLRDRPAWRRCRASPW